MLSVIMQSVIMLSVFMLSVVRLSVAMLSVVAPCKTLFTAQKVLYDLSQATKTVSCPRNFLSKSLTEKQVKNFRFVTKNKNSKDPRKEGLQSGMVEIEIFSLSAPLKRAERSKIKFCSGQISFRSSLIFTFQAENG
jgi:hypothetical protein